MEEYRDMSGRLTIALSDDDRQFAIFAERLKKFGGRPKEKLNGLDQRYWDFEINGVTVVLHSDPRVGVSIHVEDGSNDELLRSVAAACLAEKQQRAIHRC